MRPLQEGIQSETGDPNSIGIGGGDYVKFMSDDTEDVAADIAKFLVGWATGGDLSKD